MVVPIRILLVDDSARADPTAAALEREDGLFTVETAPNASEGSDRLAGEAYDCVLSDDDLPDAGGVEFLESVREEYPELPFVLVTGSGGERVVSDAIAAGATDVFPRTAAGRYAALANRIRLAVDGYRARVALEETSRRLSRAYERMSDGLFEVDADWRYTRVNERGARLVGRATDDLLGERVWDAFPGLAASPFGDDLRTAMAERESTSRTAYYPPHDTWYDVSVYPESDDGLSVYVRDVTDRKVREDELATSEERYRTLLESSSAIIFEEDFSRFKRRLDSLEAEVGDLRAYFERRPEEIATLVEEVEIVDVTRKALDYYEASSKAELLENLEDRFSEKSYEANKEIGLRLAAGETEFRVRSITNAPGGERKHEVIDVSVPKSAVDDFSRVYLTVTDVTDRVERERELERQNERLDRFASVVSHDLRNPLILANGWVALAKEECDSDYLDEIERAHHQMETLIEDVLTLAREGDRIDATESVALAECVESCRRTVETAAARLVIETNRTIRADRTLLRQLLENLVRNAIEHGGDGVTITVGDLDAGFYVADDGPGVPPDERETVFEAGYTTSAEGTGFGLAIVEQIADAHGWSLAVTDSADGGARFEFTGVEVVR